MAGKVIMSSIKENRSFIMSAKKNVWTKAYYFGFLGYFYGAGSFCYGKTSIG